MAGFRGDFITVEYETGGGYWPALRPTSPTDKTRSGKSCETSSEQTLRASIMALEERNALRIRAAYTQACQDSP